MYFFDGENISFDASLFIYIYIKSTNIPPIVVKDRIYEHKIYFFNVLLPVHLAILTIVTSHGHQYGLTITEAVLTQFCLS
jgi:hypothetical protein